MSKEEILNYVMNSPENTNKAVLNSMLDSMSGGGSSDFSIAEVTIANVYQEYSLTFNDNGFNCPRIYDEDGHAGIMPIILGTPDIPAGESAVIQVPLYKGNCTWFNFCPHNWSIASVSGDIVNNNGVLTITGDCTINITGPQ